MTHGAVSRKRLKRIKAPNCKIFSRSRMIANAHGRVFFPDGAQAAADNSLFRVSSETGSDVYRRILCLLSIVRITSSIFIHISSLWICTPSIVFSGIKWNSDSDEVLMDLSCRIKKPERSHSGFFMESVTDCSVKDPSSAVSDQPSARSFSIVNASYRPAFSCISEDSADASSPVLPK